MNGFEGDWKHLRGRIKERWNRLTDKDLSEINARDKLETKLQLLYGWDKHRIDDELDHFEQALTKGKNIERKSGKSRYFPDQQKPGR